MMQMPKTFREFADAVKGSIEYSLARVEGERDPLPMLYVARPGHLDGFGLDPLFFHSAEGVNYLVDEYAVKFTRQHDAQWVGWTFNSWAAPHDSEHPSDHPDRWEAANAVVLDREVHEVWTAQLARVGGKAVPGEWQVTTNDSLGRLIQPVQEAMR